LPVGLGLLSFEIKRSAPLDEIRVIFRDLPEPRAYLCLAVPPHHGLFQLRHLCLQVGQRRLLGHQHHLWLGTGADDLLLLLFHVHFIILIIEI
jgi:hypothetical protein